MTRTLLAALLPLCIVGRPTIALPQETVDRLEVHAVVEEDSPGTIEVPSRFTGETFHVQPEVLLSSRDIKSATAWSME